MLFQLKIEERQDQKQSLQSFAVVTKRSHTALIAGLCYFVEHFKIYTVQKNLPEICIVQTSTIRKKFLNLITSTSFCIKV